MPENKELLQYIDEHVSSIRHADGWHFFSDIECLLPSNYLYHQRRIKDFQVYEDDIWVLSYPKCGTTWLQELLWLVANDLDYKGAEVTMYARYPFIELTTFMDFVEDTGAFMDTIKQAENMPRPRFIKSHLPLALLPTQLLEKKPRVFVILRDPKDVAVSYLYHKRLFVNYSGTPEKFYEAFLEGCVNYSSYWHYVAPLWKLRHESNVFVTTYEEMKKDLPSVIQRTAKFLYKTVKEEDTLRLLNHLSFAKMKANDATNYKSLAEKMNNVFGKETPEGEFMRKGQVGDYKEAMSKEMVTKFDCRHAEMKQKLGLADDKDFPF